MLTTDDRIQIHETLALHAHLVDTNELDRLDELFTPDAVYDLRASGLGLFTGLEQLRAAAAQLFASGRAPLAHFLTNVVTTGTDEDTATARSKGLMIMSDGSLHGVVHDDVLRRQHGGWRISRRVITPVRPAAGAAGPAPEEPRPAA